MFLKYSPGFACNTEFRIEVGDLLKKPVQQYVQNILLYTHTCVYLHACACEQCDSVLEPTSCMQVLSMYPTTEPQPSIAKQGVHHVLI